jgi:hypothetical protein
MHTWEVSTSSSLSTRRTLYRDVTDSDLPDRWLRAYRFAQASPVAGRTPAVLVTRTDWTPEARRAKWESDFYDLDKAGRRRRRWKKTPIEREYEAAATAERKAKREAKALAKAEVEECKDCGHRWAARADDYGLVHLCGKGLIRLAEKENE